MQITTYTDAVAAAIEYFAAIIANCAADSVAENTDYSVTDSADSVNFIMQNYMQHSTVASLASAALASTLDTIVRENIHAVLTE